MSASALRLSAPARRSSGPAAAPRLLQRACACGGHCADCRSRRLPGAAVPAVDAALRGGGRPLDPATRGLLEPRFGHDFGGVRVHAGPAAARAAQAVHAQAFTLGRDIVLGEGAPAPRSAAGQRLMAHELAHVVQQRGQADAGEGAPILSGDAGLEAKAERLGTAALAGGAAGPASAAARAVQRQAAGTAPAAPAVPALPRRQALANLGRGGARFDAEIDRDACLLAATMKIQFNFVNVPKTWPSEDAKASWRRRFIERVTSRWSGRFDLAPGNAAGCPGETCKRLGVVVQVQPVTSGAHAVATVGHTTEHRTSSAGLGSTTLDTLDVEERSDTPQVPAEHEFGHLLGLPHVSCDRNDQVCYGTTDEEKANIMGGGSRVDVRDYQVFAEVAERFSPCGWRPVSNRSPGLRALAGLLIGGGVGAGIGFLLGGPIGALIGGLAGGLLGAAIGAGSA
ncbi:DUF4157 domain-containing protein [Roseomonas sp. GCM10028921]